MTAHAPSFDYPRLLGDVTAEFAAAVRVGDLDADVAACPGWQVRDLVGHLGSIHRWAAQIVRTRQPTRYSEAPYEGSSAESAAHWYAEAASALLAELADSDDEAPCWNFSGVHQWGAFWPRRQVHEVRIHL